MAIYLFIIFFFFTEKPVRMTDVDNFTTTHYHILEQYSIDKANPVTQVRDFNNMRYKTMKKKNERKKKVTSIC